MGDEISEGPAKGKAGGGAKASKAAKVHREFWQATSLVANMPAVTTGDTLQFSHGQRSGRKGTPAVNGVLPGIYTEGAVVIQHWDGVNLFKYYTLDNNQNVPLTFGGVSSDLVFTIAQLRELVVSTRARHSNSKSRFRRQ